MVSDADNFILNFPIDATGQDRALLLGAALLLDFRYFEQSGQQNGGRNNRNGGFNIIDDFL